ncbi:helix-turn-helix domain-containing protein [Pseudothauera rhizosphaerae]|uniref:Helix-turn-helix domain-containing protein n=1 Tax=Pseudothauera rhizosphaerae TaxID=2565932 RepID=A0A4V3WAR4_9RHOO|nr:helix-turn-helix domain-containing protein [Pseudothauera rhizosphaerae]THF60311.1 helix-turn-helix domain-containing protein [Pseudothauera rhizosphaerae]
MPIVLSTDDIPPSERLAYWSAALGERLGCTHRIASPAALFSARMTLLPLGTLSVVDTAGCPMSCTCAPERGAVSILLDGSLSVVQGETRFDVGPGGLFLLDTGMEAELRFGADFRLLSVWMSAERMAESFPRWRRLLGITLPTACGPAAVLVELLESMLRMGRTLAPVERAGLANALVGILGTVLTTFHDAAAQYKAGASRLESYHVQRVKAFVRAHLHDAGLSIGSIAQGVGLSVSYIHKLFAREPMRLMQWVTAARLEACRRELACHAETRRPIYQIAEAWGFEDQASFSRAFRARFGITPKQARDGHPPCLDGATGKAPDCTCLEDSSAKNGEFSAKTCFRSGC